MTHKSALLKALFLIPFLFTGGCVSHQPVEQTVTQETKENPSGASQIHNLPPVISENDQACKLKGYGHSEDFASTLTEEWTKPEPEKTIGQEIKELEALGQWEEGSPITLLPPEGDVIEYDFPVTLNKQVQFYLDFFQNSQKNSFARWLSHSSQYIPLVKKMLRDAGLPLDLAYLPIIESGYSLTAYSSAKAAGPWQFIRSTGKHYGLRIDTYVDERREIIKSTNAAIAFLSELYATFDSWHLAVAGYNAGAGTIKKAMRKAKSDSFWDLAKTSSLKTETKRYVPKLIAAIIIAKDPETFGFTNIDYMPPLQYETVEIPRWTHLKAVSVACNADIKTLKNLNRELRKGITPPDCSYSIKIPLGKSGEVAKNLPHVKAHVTTRYETHIVRQGDTLASICKHYNLNSLTLLKANNLRKSKLRSGIHLRIPINTTTYKLLPPSLIAQEGGKDSANFTSHHIVRPGETLSTISMRHGATPQLLAEWNNISDVHQIKAGDKIIINPSDLAEKSYSEKREAGNPPKSKRIITAGKYKIKTHRSHSRVASKKSPMKKFYPKDISATYYEVKGGDSLWKIARMHNTSTKEIIKWNNLKKGARLFPGQRLMLRTSL